MVVVVTMTRLMFLAWVEEELGVSGDFRRAFFDGWALQAMLNYFHPHSLKKEKKNYK